MKLLILSIVLLSICFELHARCVQSHSGDCPSGRIFSERERPVKIHYIYKGESCDCPKYHDLIIEQPLPVDENIEKSGNYEFKATAPVEKPKEETGEEEEKCIRYMFDVHIQKPVENKAQEISASYDYKIQEAPESIQPSVDSQSNSIRYIYDTRVETPVKPCEEKQWQGLMAQIDTFVMPQRSADGCSNPLHTPESCNCGCRDRNHTPGTCNCQKGPFSYSSSAHEVVKRIKRDSDSIKKSAKSKHKHREFKLPKMKKIDPKELSALLKADSLKQRLPATPKKFELPLGKGLRAKRREDSPCGYTFESCDPKRKTPAGCPLCYKCKCEPADESDAQKFSAKNIRVPYQIVSHGEQFTAPSQQEFDFEPSAYTGLTKPDMYKQYIEQIISKYPDHMARQMPDLMEQQRDLLNFINELARNDKSPHGNVDNEDIRYKLLDNAVELYKMYEGAIGKKPRTLSNGKLFSKRGTLIEIVDSDDSGNVSDNL